MGTDFTARQGALGFASRGFPVFPIYGVVERDGKLHCACGDSKCDGNNRGKHPLRGSHGFKDATCDLDQIRAWNSDCNYGIATGPLLVVDIDPRNGGDKEWEKFYRKNYLVHTWEVVTGGGGRHVIFANPTEVKCGKLAQGIEVKGHGGYIVGVGSRHITGKSYKWAAQCSPKEAELANPPQWVLDEIGKAQPANGERLPPETWTCILDQGFVNGTRNNSFTKIIGHLLGCGVDTAITWHAVRCMNRCSPEPEEEAPLEELFKRLHDAECRKRGV